MKPTQYQTLIQEKIIDEKADSVLLYIARDAKWLKRESLGQEKTSTNNLL